MSCFLFQTLPIRVESPEAAGLRHLSFAVEDVEETASALNERGVETVPIRKNNLPKKKYTFFQEPDRLLLELYEI